MSLKGAISTLARLVSHQSVSSDSNMAIASDIANSLIGCGARVEVQEDEAGRKANVFATIGPDIDGGIVLSGHTDVVPADALTWSSDPFTMREADGRLYGRGTCDMKGFIAAALTTAPLFAAAKLQRPIHFAFTYDEEVGCLGARRLVDWLSVRPTRPSMAIVGEPTQMRVVDGHKGSFDYTTRFAGLDGHASDPRAGANAAHAAVRYASLLLALGERLRVDAPPNPFDPPYTTLQVGRMSGGLARNIIAPEAELDWEMRPVSAADADAVKVALAEFCESTILPEMRKAAPRARVELEIIGEAPPLVPRDDNEARDLAKAILETDVCHTVSFGTEAGLFQSIGMSAVVCGPGSIAQAHQADEYLEVEQLAAALAMLEGLVPILANRPSR